MEYESDPDTLKRRQKQIDYGKNTKGYDNYILTVPRQVISSYFSFQLTIYKSRDKRVKGDPMTPNKYLKYSRRGWDGLIKQWRKKLHDYDPDKDELTFDD